MPSIPQPAVDIARGALAVQRVPMLISKRSPGAPARALATRVPTMALVRACSRWSRRGTSLVPSARRASTHRKPEEDWRDDPVEDGWTSSMHTDGGTRRPDERRRGCGLS